jgi:Zn-dependent protease with chaperone function
MPIDFEGVLDGRPVTVRVASGGLVIGAEGAERVWLYSDLRLTHVEPVRFQYQHQSLQMADARVLAHIERENVEAFKRMSGDILASPLNWVWLTIGGIVAGLLITWFYLIPAFAGVLANRVPVSWEDKIGESVERSFLLETGECKEQPAVQAVEEIVRRLDRAAPSDYKFRVSISNSAEMNAFAAPGGHIVVLRGLMEAADTPEEVAGVLAHEMEHVRQRHVTRGMFRQLTLSALFALIFGDAGAAGSIVKGLGSLQFQREDEAAADREGMRNLASAGMDPKAMISFFRKLKKQEVDMPRMAEYLSSHPDTQERIAALEQMAGELRVNERPLESRATWLQTRGLCK